MNYSCSAIRMYVYASWRGARHRAVAVTEVDLVLRDALSHVDWQRDRQAVTVFNPKVA